MIKEFSLIEFEEVSSTQDMAHQLIAQDKISHGDVIIAKKQTNGRGRYTRHWDSEGGNLFFTIIIKPEMEQNIWSQVSYIAGEALAQSILNIDSGLKVSLKWINDILVDDKKVAGILLEKNDLGFLLIGVGINLFFSNEFSNYNATGLDQHSNKFNYQKLLDAFLEQFKYLYNEWNANGFIPIKNLWLKRAKNLGEEIIVKLPNKNIKGIFVGINDQGYLQLLSEDEIIKINSGELFF